MQEVKVIIGGRVEAVQNSGRTKQSPERGSGRRTGHMEGGRPLRHGWIAEAGGEGQVSEGTLASKNIKQGKASEDTRLRGEAAAAGKEIR